GRRQVQSPYKPHEGQKSDFSSSPLDTADLNGCEPCPGSKVLLRPPACLPCLPDVRPESRESHITRPMLGRQSQTGQNQPGKFPRQRDAKGRRNGDRRRDESHSSTRALGCHCCTRCCGLPRVRRVWRKRNEVRFRNDLKPRST